MDASSTFGAEDFKEHIHNLLVKRGVQNGLKANLRAQILRAARSDGFIGASQLNTDWTMDEKIGEGMK